MPQGGLLLVGGADVQKDRIEVSIWAFGRGKESWLVEHRVLMGDTSRIDVWGSLAGMIYEDWPHENGAMMPIARFAIDSGYATQEVYDFVRRLGDSRVMAIKGVQRGAALIGTPTAVDVTTKGKKLHRGAKVFPVVGSIAKMEFYRNLKKVPEVADDGVSLVYPEGFVHLPKMDAEYLQQLCAEQLVTRRNRQGFSVREWQKTRERNEGLDAYVYARAAASAAGLDRFAEHHWRELEKSLGIGSTDPPRQRRNNHQSDLEATQRGGLSVSGVTKAGRRTIRSPWLGR
ncbi:hypothetical protein CCP4SC76_7350001 [Gammaproteobacteria bacterium]